MNVTDNPINAFRQIDASSINEDSYTFHIDESSMVDLDSDRGQVSKKTVTFKRVDEEQRKKLALETIEEAAEDVYQNIDGDFDTLPEKFDLLVRSSGRLYAINSNEFGYEVVREKEPLRVAYTSIFDDNVIRLV